MTLARHEQKIVAMPYVAWFNSGVASIGHEQGQQA